MFLPAARDLDVSNVEIPADSGLSNQTILFVAEFREGTRNIRLDLVARVQPTGPSVFPSYDVGLEAAVMTSLARSTELPVPKVLFLEQDSTFLGAPFLVMDRLPGVVPADDPPFTVAGWILELTDAERNTVYDNGLRALASVHAVDWREIGLTELAGGVDPLDDQFTLYERYFEWAAEGESNPTIEAALSRLREIRPASAGERALCWGDARLGNLLYRADQSVAGILDWEMATTGPPGLDLGWWLFTLRHHTEGIGAPMPAGFLNREATVARYEELSGRSISGLDFYEAFGGLKIRTTLAALLPMSRDHHRVLELLNGALLGDHSRFATLVLASVRRQAGVVRLRLTSAGHAPPLIVRADGRVEEVAATGSLIGVLPQVMTQTVDVDLAPGEPACSTPTG